MKIPNSKTCVLTGPLNQTVSKSIETRDLKIISLILIFPIFIIGCLQWVGATGLIGYHAYKIGFILPPLIYCRFRGISILKDIIGWPFQFQDLQRGCAWAVFFFAIFWSAFLLFGDWLIDKNDIVQNMNQQFLVNAFTIWLIAPVTIFLPRILFRPPAASA